MDESSKEADAILSLALTHKSHEDREAFLIEACGLDQRTDIWSYGCVLYECLTGKRLFEGTSATDLIGAVLHKEPNWNIVTEKTPAPIYLLLRKCLTNDRKHRLQHIGDVRVDLETAIADPNWGLESGQSSVQGISKGVLAVAFVVTGLIAASLS